jgi:hypothetical protein
MGMGEQRNRPLGWALAVLVGALVCGAPAAAQEVLPDDPARQDLLKQRIERRRVAHDRIQQRLERYRDASPEQRRELREALRERWLEADSIERVELKERFHDLSRERRLERMGLPPEDLERHRQRLEGRDERRQMLRVVPSDQRHELARSLLEMSPAERRGVRRRLGEMPAAERQALAERVRAFRELDSDQQRALGNRLGEMLELDDKARARLGENAERWQSMSEQDRDRMRSQLHRLHAIPPDERVELLDQAFGAD